MDTEQRMRNALKQGADGLRLPEPGPAAARDRALQRARRRQAGMGGLTALAVVLAGVTGWQLLPEEQVRFEGAQTADGGGATITGPLADLDWRDAEGVVAGNSEIIYSADGLYYALSTAPGARYEDFPDGAIPQTLYRSADGLSWEMADLGEKPWIADLDEREGVLYAVSTAPTTNGEGNGRVGISSDGGQTWTQADLPSTATPPDATVDVAGPFATAAIAVGESVMLARSTTTYRLDADEVFPEKARNDDYWVEETPEGLSLMESGCDLRDEMAAHDVAVDEGGVEPMPVCRDGAATVRTVPWADLGLEGPGDLRAEELFRSEDGETWEPIDASAFAGRGVLDLTAGPQGFYAVVTPSEEDWSTRQLLTSVDGATWQEVELPAPVMSLGFVGERIVGVTDLEGGLEALTSTDGGATWTRTDLAQLVDPEGEFDGVGQQVSATGPLGVAVVTIRHERSDSHTLLLTSSDGVAWSVTPLADIVGEDEPNMVSWVAVGEDAIALSAAWYGGGDDTAVTRTFVGTPVRR